MAESLVTSLLRFSRVFYDRNEWQVPVASGGVEAVADNKLVRHDKAGVIDRRSHGIDSGDERAGSEMEPNAIIGLENKP